MPPVAVAVAAAAASAAASSSLTVFAFGSFYLGSGALGSAIAGGVVGFAVNRLGGAVIGGGKKSRAASSGGGSFDDGFRQVVRLSDASQKIVYGRTRVGGHLAYIETYPSAPDSDGATQTGDNLFLHMAIIHAGHECDAVEQVYINDDLVTLDAGGFVNEAPYKKDGKSYVRIIHRLGTDTQTAIPQMQAECTNWTADHRLRGLCYSYIRMQWNPDVFVNGIPTVNVVLRGKKVYDPRTTLVAWSNNAALVACDYLTSRDNVNIPYGFGAGAGEIDDSYTIAAANICDELITKLDSSTIPRYTCNGALDTEQPVLDNLEILLSAMVGTVATPKGQFRIYAGAYNTPEAAVIDESWLSGAMRTRNRIERQSLFNAVKGRYTNPAKNWQNDDFPAITSAAFQAQDNGERIFTEIDLPFTTDGEAAQRIAKTILRKNREQISITMPCNYKALQFAVWDVVKVSNAARGWVEKPFRITSFNYELRQGVTLELREENATSYDWTASDAEAIASAPDTDLPSPYVVAVPSSVAYTSRAVSTVGGDTVYNLVLTWAPYNNSYVRNGGQFEIQFKESLIAEWRPSFFVSGDSTFADIPNTSPNIEYDLRIRAVNVLGVRSNWVTILDALIGSSGGVINSLDWDSVAATATFFNDWDSVAAPESFTNDWGSVA